MDHPHTLVHRIERWAKERPESPALHGKNADGTWRTYTWKQYWTAVREAAKGLISLGVEQGNAVAISGGNSPEWVIAEFAIMAARGIPAPIYPTSTVDQIGYIVGHCEAKIIINDGAELLARFLEANKASKLNIEHFLTLESGVDADTEKASLRSIEALRKLGREQDDAELDKRLSEIKGDDVALLIFTSGTTGLPKGAMIDHAGILADIDPTIDTYPVLRDGLRIISYLPLSHVAEQYVTNYAGISAGGEVYFCPDLKQIKDYLTEVRPTAFLGVPRVWEKFQAALGAKLAEATGIKSKLAGWAMRTELACHRESVRTGKPVNTFSRRLANKLVLSKIRAKLGLDELKLAVTGAAPIAVATLDFFASLGVVIHEGYGMTETSGIATLSEYGRPVAGSVGRAIHGVEIKIADDGEIQLRGRSMVKGYYKLAEKTAELWSEDGWMCTGDLGSVDENGLLRITGRKKDILITAGAKNIAPAEMEAHLMTITGVGQAVVVGDRKPYLCALLVLDPEALPDLREKLSLPADTSLKDVAESDKVREFFEKQIETECNAKVARYQTIKKFEVLPAEFSVDGGELTPTLKVKRNVVNEKYAATIEAMYERETAPVG